MVLKVSGDSIQKVASEFTKIIDSNVGVMKSRTLALFIIVLL